jgi:hypothetical protein
MSEEPTESREPEEDEQLPEAEVLPAREMMSLIRTDPTFPHIPPEPFVPEDAP